VAEAASRERCRQKSLVLNCLGNQLWLGSGLFASNCLALELGPILIFGSTSIGIGGIITTVGTYVPHVRHECWLLKMALRFFLSSLKRCFLVLFIVAYHATVILVTLMRSFEDSGMVVFSGISQISQRLKFLGVCHFDNSGELSLFIWIHRISIIVLNSVTTSYLKCSFLSRSRIR